MQSLQTILADIKKRKALTQSAVQGLGPSVHDKLQNLIKNEKIIITHAFFPEGNPEKVAAMKEIFQKKYGFELPAELVSFYEIFDGFELRIVNFEKDMPYFLSENQELVKRLNLPADFASLSLKEWQSDKYRDAFEEIRPAMNLDNFYDTSLVEGRTTNPGAKDITYYEDHVHIEDVHGRNTVIPSADRLFDEGNKSGNAQGLDLYYFDFFGHFNQVVLGVGQGQIHLYQVKYGHGELRKIREDIANYLKKIIIRSGVS